MAKISVIGNAVVLTSTIKYEDIKKAKKYRPDALILKDEDGEKEIFRVDIGSAQANAYGIVFDGKTHDDDGFATYTQLIPNVDAARTKEAIADIYGAALLKLKKLEEAFPAAIEAIDTERAVVLGQISLA